MRLGDNSGCYGQRLHRLAEWPPVSNPPAITPTANRLQAHARTQLQAPAALLVPAGIRHLVEELAAVVVTLAGAVDELNSRIPHP